MHREVNLTKRVQTPHGCGIALLCCPPMAGSSQTLVLVNGKPERHPEGAYYIEWHDGGKRVRLSVGKDAADASATRLRKETELNLTTAMPRAGDGHERAQVGCGIGR